MMLLPNVSTLKLWEDLPQIADVTYISVANKSNIPLVLSEVVTTPVGVSEAAPSYGKYKKWRTSFKIDPEVWDAAVAIAGASNIWPKSRDYLVDAAGLTWMVEKDTAIPHQGNPYRLSCNRLTFSLPLADTVTIYTATNSIDSNLGPAVNQTGVLARGLQCAVQPVDPQLIEPGKFQGKQGFRQKYIVYVPVPLIDFTPTLYTVGYGYTIQDQNNLVYSVEGWRSPQRIDMLQEINCWRNP